jgi:hypothetical protein
MIVTAVSRIVLVRQCRELADRVTVADFEPGYSPLYFMFFRRPPIDAKCLIRLSVPIVAYLIDDSVRAGRGARADCHMSNDDRIWSNLDCAVQFCAGFDNRNEMNASRLSSLRKLHCALSHERFSRAKLYGFHVRRCDVCVGRGNVDAKKSRALCYRTTRRARRASVRFQATTRIVSYVISFSIIR